MRRICLRPSPCAPPTGDTSACGAKLIRIKAFATGDRKSSPRVSRKHSSSSSTKKLGPGQKWQRGLWNWLNSSACVAQRGIDIARDAARVAESGFVLLVSYLLHPLDCLSVELFLNGNVGHCSCGPRAVPMLFTRREPDH